MKHWVLHYNSEGVPNFEMKVVQHHRSVLSRQVGEAIRIRRRMGTTLNSKSEYNRCKIGRLSLETMEQDEQPAIYKDRNEEDIKGDWFIHLLRKRDMQDRVDRQELGKVVVTASTKRRDSQDNMRGKSMTRLKTGG